MNIGDTVEYYNVYDEKKSGVITEVFSDMDSYEDIRLENGVPLYYSKKLSHFVPVKEKNKESKTQTAPKLGIDLLREHIVEETIKRHPEATRETILQGMDDMGFQNNNL